MGALCHSHIRKRQRADHRFFRSTGGCQRLFAGDEQSPGSTLARLSLSYRLFGAVYLNGSIGRYYELPPYTVLGFKDNQGNYLNKANHLTYIRSDQAGLGLEYRPSSYLKFSAEGFYKKYDQYPMSLVDSIPLASKGTDYGF